VAGGKAAKCDGMAGRQAGKPYAVAVVNAGRWNRVKAGAGGVSTVCINVR